MNIITNIQFGDNQSELYNKSYLVVDCKTHFSRGFSGFNPTETPSCKKMEVTVIAPERGDLFLYEWFTDNGYKTGRMLFDIVNVNANADDTVKRQIIFEDAQCYAIKESYDIDKDERRHLTLSLSIKKCYIEDVEFYHVKNEE